MAAHGYSFGIVYGGIACRSLYIKKNCGSYRNRHNAYDDTDVVLHIGVFNKLQASLRKILGVYEKHERADIYDAEIVFNRNSAYFTCICVCGDFQ